MAVKIYFGALNRNIDIDPKTLLSYALIALIKSLLSELLLKNEVNSFI